ncbi:MAG TPA: hypothetical protein VGN85_05245 [Methyloceanibacter sp.]|jgi:hypothetical protein|nr:hypothetical protein [Methyloceanibacter sp.]
MRIVADVGFEAVDAGELKVARLLEPLAMLWVQLALAKGQGATSPSSWRGVKMPQTPARALGRSILRERSDRVMLQQRPAIVS